MTRRFEVDQNAVLGGVGLVLVVLGLAQLLPVACALVRGEPWLRLAGGALGVLGCGCALLPLRRRVRKVTRRESLATVVAAWLVAVTAAAVPYVVTGVALPLDALFESASGLTTTGASIMVDVDRLSTTGDPPAAVTPLIALHLWRCLTQWIGGAGIILVVFILTPFLRDDDLRRTQGTEAGILTVRYRGSTRSTLRGLLRVYVGLTLAQTVVLTALGLHPFEALLHAFTTVATGGFSTRTASMASWGPAVQLVTALFMVLGALNFAVMGRAVEELRQRWRVERAARGAARALPGLVARAPLTFVASVWKDAETRAYLQLVGGASLAMLALLLASGAARYDGAGASGRAAVDGLFNVVTVSSTTGFGGEDFVRWPQGAQALLFLLMLVGGCSGSTAGGLKLRRVQIALLCTWRELRRAVHPAGVFPLKLGGQRIDEDQAREALTYLFTYLLLLVLVSLLLTVSGVDLVTAAGATASCFASTGPGLGAAGPAANYQVFTAPAKALLMAAMLLGRLEIYPLVNALTPSFWLRRTRVRGWW